MIAFIQRRWVANTLKVGVGLAFLLVTMRYVFKVPLIADDFYLYVDWARRRATESFGDRLDLGGIFEAGRILPIGTGFTPVWLDSIYAAGDLFGVSPDIVWRSWRIIAVVLAVIAASAFAVAWRLRSPVTGSARQVAGRAPWMDDLTTWFVVIAIATGSFIQIHSLWGNDPVTAYIYPAWGTCVLYFGYLALLRPALRARGDLPAVALVLGAIVGVVGVWFYELFLPAIALAALAIVVVGVRRALRAGMGAALRPATALLAFSVLPGIAFLIPRLSGPGTVSGDAMYPGTSYKLSGQSLETFWGALVTSFPGSSWWKSREFVGPLAETQGVSVQLVVTLILLIAFAWWLVRMQGASVQAGRPRRLSRVWLLGVLLAIGALTGPIAIQSVSSRWQDELGGGIGNVYTFWATSSTAVALLVAMIVILLVTRASPWPGAIAATVIAAIAVMQVSVNVQVEQLTQAYLPVNMPIIKALESDPATGDAERCAAITALAAFPFPDYYEVGIGYSAVTAYKAEHGVPFCRAKPDIFDKPYLGG